MSATERSSLYWPKNVDRFEYEYATNVLLKDLVLTEEPGNCAQRIVVLGDPSTEDLAQLQGDDALLHLSDEGLRHQTSHYQNVRVVLRNYANPNFSPISSTPVFTVPLGFQSGFTTPTQAESVEPHYTWSFIGAKRKDRDAILKLFESITPNFTFLTSQWADPKGLAPESCREIYSQSFFVICPPGNIHPDTFRVMEALEAGAIPVLTEFQGVDIFRYTLGSHPLPVLRDWNQARDFVQELSADLESLQFLRKDVREWYLKFKVSLALDVARIVSDSSVRAEDLLGDQWRLQIEMSQSSEMRKQFSQHFNPVRKSTFFQRLKRKIIRAISPSVHPLSLV